MSYKGGRIMRIKMKNFMTYDNFELIPKTGLNLVLGLNGSGKSSIMCAICLGLAGHPKFTGRSAQLIDFIKVGQQKAYVEIELENPNGKNIVIGRNLTRKQSEKSSWSINNRPVQQTEVVNIMKKFNIDVGNLCQFLPQEKVAEFSKMDKKLRLESMLQAIGEPSLFNAFSELKTMQSEIGSHQKDLGKLQNSQTIEMQANERLNSEVEKHEERLRLQDQIATLKLTKLLKEYEISRLQVIDISKEKNALNETKTNLEKKLANLKKQQEGMSSDSKSYTSKMNQLARKISEVTDKLTRKQGQLQELHAQVDSAKIHYRNRLAEKDNQKTKLQELQLQIRALEDQHENTKERASQINVEMSAISQQFETIKNELAYHDGESENINLEINRLDFNVKAYERKITEISNEENKKMDLLRQRYKGTYDAILWLKQNKDSFRANICEPPLISIKVNDDNNRRFIENHVSMRDLLILVCEDPEDVKRLTSILREQRRLPINIAMAPRESLADFVSPRITPEMSRLGIKCFMRDLIIAPEPVMRYLCRLYYIHLIPICDNSASRNIDSILQMFQRFFTPNEKISGKTSKYGNKAMSVRRDHITDRKILPNFKDKSDELHEYEKMLQKAKNEIVGLRTRYECSVTTRNALERKQEQIRTERSKLLEELKRVNSIQLQLKQKEALYLKKSSEVVNEKEEKMKVIEKICSAREQEANIISSIHLLLTEYFSLKIQKAKLIIALQFLTEKLTTLTREIVGIRESLQTVTREFEQKRAKIMELKDNCKAMKTRIEAKLSDPSIKLSDGNSLEQWLNKMKTTKLLAHSDSDLADIDQKIANIQAQLDLNCEDYDSIVREFKLREKVIMDVGLEIKQYKKRIDKLKAEMQAKKVKWLPKLESHITNINVKFSDYYKRLKCAGEISLDTGEDSDDFAKYGLQIRLKYRAEENFMELSQTHHSGGECSVAAIIFILSLQGQTEVPFRCIDEINQGMDAVNERKMYDLIADASSGGACSQYFLLTPKLLMNLDLAYHNKVAVHTIFNSPYLKMHVNLQKHLEIRKSIKR